MVNFQNVINYFSKKKKSSKKFAGEVKCEDCVWGKLTKGKINQYPRSEIDGRVFPQKLIEDNVIIIIAESPHYYEYSLTKKGCKFKSPLHNNDLKITTYLKNNKYSWFNKKKCYDVVLVNAIQYQCSFGLPLRGKAGYKNQKQKNEIFKYTWDNEPAQIDLIDRIDNIVNNKKEVIIINACTKCLKYWCNSSIFKNNNNYKIYDENHPSQW